MAGAVGVIALDWITWFMWDREDPVALARERAARPAGLDPAHVMANQAAELTTGHALTPRQPNPAGLVAHYALGVMPGAVYGALRPRVEKVGAGRGLLLGTALFLMQDEIANTLMGTAGRPTEYPWQAHARGLIAHLVLGAVTDRLIAMTATFTNRDE